MDAQRALVFPKAIETYSDHRMAMAFAPLSILLPGLLIKDEQVVGKSYPAFWEHLISLGFNVNLQPH
jgi:3-phosphoshikimate 1-carboxyvinyltransferase